MGVGLVDEMLENCFLPLQNALAESPINPLSVDQVRDLLSALGLVSGALEGVHKNLEETMAAGVEGRKLIADLTEQADRIQMCIAMQARVREVVTNAKMPEMFKEASIAAVDHLTQGTEKLSAEVSGLLRWLGSSPPKVDPTKFRGAENTPTAEGFERVEDVIARLNGA